MIQQSDENIPVYVNPEFLSQNCWGCWVFLGSKGDCWLGKTLIGLLLTLFCLSWVALALDKGEVILDKGEVILDKGEVVLDKGEVVLDKGEIVLLSAGILNWVLI